MRYLIVAVLFFVSVGVAHAQESAATTKAFGVGTILPLTGPLSEYGVAFKNGIEMARSDNPGDFKSIAFYFEDSRYEPQRAVSVFNKLRLDPAVNMIIVWGNPTSEAVAPIAERDKVATLAGAMDPKVSIGKEYIIRANNHDSMFSHELARYIKGKGYSNIGMVLTENSYLSGILAGLEKALPKSASVSVIGEYQPGGSDFQSAVTKLKASEFDAVGVFLMSGQIAHFYRQYAEQGVSLPTFGTDFFESSTEVKLSNGAMEGAVYAQLGVSPRSKRLI